MEKESNFTSYFFAVLIATDIVLNFEIFNVIIDIAYLISIIIYVDSFQKNKYELCRVFSGLFIVLLLLRIIYYSFIFLAASRFHPFLIIYVAVLIFTGIYYSIYTKKREKRIKENLQNEKNARNLEANVTETA